MAMSPATAARTRLSDAAIAAHSIGVILAVIGLFVLSTGKALSLFVARQYLAEIGGRLLVAQGMVKRRRPAGRQRDECAPQDCGPALELVHQGLADALALMAA